MSLGASLSLKSTITSNEIAFISLNDAKVTDVNYILSDSDFKNGYAIIKKGKKVFHKLEL